MAEVTNKEGTAPGQPAGKKFTAFLKKMSLGEKIIGVGAILGLLSFFFPWIILDDDVADILDLSEKMRASEVSSWTYLFPLLMLASLGLLYLSARGAQKSKVTWSSFQILIGTLFATTGMVLYTAMTKIQEWFLDEMGELYSVYGSSFKGKEIFSFGSGIWIAILGSLAIIIGAFLAQKESLKTKE